MSCLTTLVVRVLSLIAAAGVTSLMVWVHAADLTSLGASDIAVSGAAAITHIARTDAQPAARIALARRDAL